MAVNTNTMVSNLYNSYNANNSNKSNNSNKTDKKTEIEERAEVGASRKSGDYGKMIGNAKLSEAGAKYYEELKKKYNNLDFILVSKDQKENAKAHAASYANPNKMVVLVDEDKIERMATDENYRKQYEGIIKNAASGISQLKTSLESSGQSKNVIGYGMKVNDNGTASYFAVLKKSSADQKARIEKRAEEKKAEKKAAEKAQEKAAKKQAGEEQLRKTHEKNETDKYDNDDTITITASSIEELMQKIGDYSFAERSDLVQTDDEKMVGQSIDFRG